MAMGVSLTERAAARIKELIAAESREGQGLRVKVVGGGCSGLQYEMALDHTRDGDAVVEQDGVRFFVDRESADYLRGATLDYRDGLTGTGFHIVNPNAARTCGCGSSFEAAPPA